MKISVQFVVFSFVLVVKSNGSIYLLDLISEHVNYIEQLGSFWSELMSFCHCQMWETTVANLPIDTEFITQ